MAWIKFDIATSEKPEVWQMATQLDLDPDAVVGKLLRVWAWFDEHTTNGNAPSVTKALLNSKLSVSGFCECMIAVGWMIESEGQISLPNFDRHNGTTAKNRALTAQRVGSYKERKQKVTQDFEKSNARSVTKALPREEKIREDKNNLNTPPNPQGGKQWIADDESLPESINTPEMQDAWIQWCTHRREIKKPLKRTQCRELLTELAEWGQERAIAAIRHTIRKGWQGLKEPDSEFNRNYTSQKPPPQQTFLEQLEQRRKELTQ